VLKVIYFVMVHLPKQRSAAFGGISNISLLLELMWKHRTSIAMIEVVINIMTSVISGHSTIQVKFGKRGMCKLLLMFMAIYNKSPETVRLLCHGAEMLCADCVVNQDLLSSTSMCEKWVKLLKSADGFVQKGIYLSAMLRVMGRRVCPSTPEGEEGEEGQEGEEGEEGSPAQPRRASYCEAEDEAMNIRMDRKSAFIKAGLLKLLYGYYAKKECTFTPANMLFLGHCQVLAVLGPAPHDDVRDLASIIKPHAGE
jgi:hypothetical protein